MECEPCWILDGIEVELEPALTYVAEVFSLCLHESVTA
jgi:hypothetical protein